MAEVDWRQLEQLVASIQQELAPDSTVTHDAKITGRSGAKRQIDVLVEQTVGQFQMRIALDCKDYAKPADIKDVEEFYGMLADIEVNKGALVCPKGFTEAAKARAKDLAIDLFSPVDTAPCHATLRSDGAQYHRALVARCGVRLPAPDRAGVRTSRGHSDHVVAKAQRWARDYTTPSGFERDCDAFHRTKPS